MDVKTGTVLLCALSCLFHSVCPDDSVPNTKKDTSEVPTTAPPTVANKVAAASTSPTPPPTTTEPVKTTTKTPIDVGTTLLAITKKDTLASKDPPTTATPTTKAAVVATEKPSTPSTGVKTTVITTVSKLEANPTTTDPKGSNVPPIIGPISGSTVPQPSSLNTIRPTTAESNPASTKNLVTKNPVGTTKETMVPVPATTVKKIEPVLPVGATTKEATRTTVMVTSKTSGEQVPAKSTPSPEKPHTSMSPPAVITEAGAAVITVAGAAVITEAGAAVITVAGAAVITQAGAAVITEAGAAVITEAGAAVITVAGVGPIGPQTTAGTTVSHTVPPSTTTTATTAPPQPRTFSYSLNRGHQPEEEKDLVLLCQQLMGNFEDGNCTVSYRHHNDKIHCDGVEITGKVKTTIVTQHIQDITKKPTDNRTLITILASCGALLIMIIILAVCASHHRKPFNENQQHLTEELQTVENGYHDNPTLEVMEVQPEMQEKKVALNGEFNDSWIVPIDNLLKEELQDEEDTHL